MREWTGTSADRILTLDEALDWRETQRAGGGVVVFTNGVFDLIHAGHVAYLEWARAQGDALVVAVNRDDSVRRLKGNARPFVPFEDRARVIAGLRSVDVVIGFSELTPEGVLDRLRPDVHVKSSQYRIEDLPERLVIESFGGRIVLAPHLDGQSTTDLAARIASREGRH